MSRQVFLIRLLGGEELVSALANDNSNELGLQRPMQVLMQQAQQGVALRLIPYLPLAEVEEIPLYKSSVSSKVLLEEGNELRQHYLQNVWKEEVVAVPEKKLLLPQ